MSTTKRGRASPKRFVVISDLHAHPWPAFSSGDGAFNSRLQRTLKVLNDSLERAESEKIPWLFAGDLIHTAGYGLNVVMSGLTNILQQFEEVEKVFVWGNHDSRGKGGLITPEQTIYPTLLAGLDRAVLLDDALPYECENGLTISGCGAQPREELMEFGVESTVGLYHGTVRGSVGPNGYLFEHGIDPAQLLLRHRVAIVGDIHHPQQVYAPHGQALLIPGSPEHHNFGDVGEHGWWVISVPQRKKDAIEAEFVPGGSPEFRTVTSLDEVPKGTRHYYRVRIVKAGEEVPDGVKVIAPQPTTVANRDLLNGAAKPAEVVAAWMKHLPPETDDDAAYSEVGKELLREHVPTGIRAVRLRHIELSNFCCFGSAALDVQAGHWLIAGRGKDFPSNGSGKTTLVGESLYWLLFGRTTKGLSGDDVVRWGETECSVTARLDFDSSMFGAGHLDITRSRGKDGHNLSVHEQSNGRSLVWEAASVNEMTTKLNQWLGLTPELFQNLAYFSQEKLLLFSSATDGERKNVLADLLGLGAYQEASSAAAARANELDKHREVVDGKKEVLTQQVEEAERAAELAVGRAEEWADEQITLRTNALLAYEAAREKEKEWGVEPGAERLLRFTQKQDGLTQQFEIRLHQSIPALTAEARRRAEEAQETTKKNLERQIKQAREYAASSFEGDIEAAMVAVDALDEHVEVLKSHERAVREEEKKRRYAMVVETRAVTAHESADVELAAAEEALHAAEKSLQEGVCPTCHQRVTDNHRQLCLAPVLHRTGRARTQLEAAKKAREDAHAAMLKAEAATLTASQAADAMRSYVEHIKETRERIRKLDGLARQYAAYSIPDSLVAEQVHDQIESARELYMLSKKHRMEKIRRAIQSRVAAVLADIQEAERVLRKEEAARNPHEAAVTGAYKNLDTLKEKIADYETDLETSARQSAMYEYWWRGFSKHGVQSLLVEQVAALFNQKRGVLFPLLTQGVYDVQFSALSTTKSGELREKTDFFITEHGQPIQYEALSGGQRRRIDIGIMLVLATSVAEWMGIPGILGVLILDEVFGFLDDSGAEGLLAALEQVTEQIPTIYTVTHDPHLQALVPQVVQVVQNAEGVSHVEAV